jgi:hypothetical protein
MLASSTCGRCSTLCKVRFTEGRMRKLTCPRPKEMIYRDTETPGLGLRVTVNGPRNYYERRVQGRTMAPRCDVRTCQLREARAEARRLVVLGDRG